MGDRQPILPPRPPVRLALWAAANAQWFRLAGVLSRLFAAAVRAGRRALAPREEAPIPALASAGRHSLGLDPWMFARVSGPRGAADGEDRPTVPQVRRVS